MQSCSNCHYGKPVSEQGWLVRGMEEGEDPSKALNG
jgi:hypothetical protein